MALKLKIKKAEYDKLDDATKKMYIVGEGDEYVLDTEGGEDVGALRRALERERTTNKTLSDEVVKIKEQLESVSNADARKKGDIETLEKGWKKKIDDITTDSTAKLAAKDAFISKLMIGSEASKIAMAISTVPSLMEGKIKERMTVDFTGEEPKLVILGSDGKPSGITLENLQKEFVANPEFKSIIIASKATGGAGSTEKGTPGGGAAKSSTTENDVPFAKMPVKDFAAHLKAKREASKT